MRVKLRRRNFNRGERRRQAPKCPPVSREHLHLARTIFSRALRLRGRGPRGRKNFKVGEVQVTVDDEEGKIAVQNGRTIELMMPAVTRGAVRRIRIDRLTSDDQSPEARALIAAAKLLAPAPKE